MAKYEVVETSFIGNQLRQPGEIVEHDGEVSDNLKPVEDDKPAKRAAKSDTAE